MKLPKSLNSILENVSSQFSKPKPNSFLYNRWVLYFVFAISLFQLYTFSVAGKLQHVAVFLLVAFLTSFFSKNMMVIMVIALVFTELLSVGFNNSRLEGMTEGNTQDAEDKSTKEESTATDVPAESGSAKPSLENENKKKESRDTEKKPTPNPAEVEKTQKELQENLEQINKGFEKIEPFMLQAENLVEKMNTFAKA